MNRYNAQIDDQYLHAYLTHGDGDALESLVERHRARVLNYIHTMIKDRELAEDICQDVFFKIKKVLDQGRYVDSGRFLPWVLRIAHNQVIDYFRQNKIENRYTASDDKSDVLSNVRFSDPNAEQLMETSQTEEMLRRLIETLPEEQRQVVWMRYYNSMSFSEIAEETNVSINTALGRMRYALINLRKSIADNCISLM
ncbi:RNA polymerase subunit sigma-24 [Bacteroidia bacterium]|nr:RNA polymerase subunit sigma-24 [Bacteroidia bacterium]